MITPLQQKRRESIAQLNPMPQSQRHAFDIRQVETGGFIQFQLQIWQVKSLSRYLDVKWKNFQRRKEEYYVTELELFSLKSGKTTYLEWEVDDKLEIYTTIKEIKLRELSYKGSPLTRKHLEEIAQNEHGVIGYNNKPYEYSEDDTWAAQYFRGDIDTKKGSCVRFYEFFDREDEEALSVELWYDDLEDERPQREAFLSSDVAVSDIAVLQLKA